MHKPVVVTLNDSTVPGPGPDLCHDRGLSLVLSLPHPRDCASVPVTVTVAHRFGTGTRRVCKRTQQPAIPLNLKRHQWPWELKHLEVPTTERARHGASETCDGRGRSWRRPQAASSWRGPSRIVSRSELWAPDGIGDGAPPGGPRQSGDGDGDGPGDVFASRLAAPTPQLVQ
jgi:hypothetical protein